MNRTGDPPAVEVRDLRKRFGTVDVLNGISLTAKTGDVVAIIGGSGSGKSTTLRCINMLEMPTSGEIAIKGETIELTTDRRGATKVKSAKQLRAMRTKLAMVFQGFNLWQHMTVLGNVIEAPIHVLGVPRDEAVERGRALLDRVGLADKHDAYPAFLSGGQQQRAAIARALAVEPEVMLFDEPTSALDPELVGEVLSVIADLAKEGRTMLLVTHEMSFARDVASHVVFLHNGVVTEEGAPSALFSAPKTERLQRFLATIQ
ncbi:MAG: ATP-binding cassette domain-containing protein [Pseudomonadota bacterium]